MGWIVPTVLDLEPYVAAGALQEWRTRQVRPGGADPLPALLAGVCGGLRAELRAAGAVSATGGAIPPELVPAAAALTIELAQARFPQFAPGELVKLLAREARETVTRAARGQFAVSPPDDPEDGPARRTEVLAARAEGLTAAALAGL